MNRIALFAALAFALAHTPVLAQPAPSDRDKAIAHYNQAEAYFKAGTYDKAVEEYKKSYALEPAPLLLFNIGLAEEKRKNRDEAISYYDQYLAAEPNGLKANEARARKVALERARDSEAKTKAERDADLKARRASIDALVAAGKFTEAIGELRALFAIDPRPPLIFEIAEAYRGAKDSDAAIKEYNRYIETGDRTHATDAQTRIDELEAAEAARLEAERRAALTGDDKPSIILPAAVSGGAAVLLTVGAIFGSRASSIESELSDGLANRTPPIDSSDPRFDDGKSAAITANIFFGLGAATAIGAGYLWYRYLSHSPRREQPRTTVVPTGRGAAVRVTF